MTTNVKNRIFGLKTELFQYMSIVLPLIDVLVISFIAYNSDNIVLSTILNLYFPIFGVLSIKATERFNSVLFYHVFFVVGLFILALLYFYAGINSAAWLQSLPVITAVFFLVKNFLLRLLYIILYLFIITIVAINIGISLPSIYTMCITIVVFSTILERSFSFLIKQQKNIESQKIVIQKQHNDIIENITYAKHLQTAILPSENYWNKHLPKNFVLYKPKDVVSGDFYWLQTVNNNTLFAAADCTGHGVSGAMVSIVCSNALNRTVNELKIIEPAKILDKTRQLVLETFEKSESDIKDGMDISLCLLNTKTNELLWSGANNSLLHITENTLKEKKGDKQPVGKAYNPKPFTTHKIELQKGDTFYIFTDGFADQFGGQNGKKLMKKRLKEILLQIQQKTMDEQGKYLSDFIENWKAGKEQVDDILIIGVQV